MSAQPESTGRARRADAGTPRATARDALGMSWVVEMGGMPLDLLRRVTVTSDPASRQMIRRWRVAGWAQTGHRGAGPLWVWGTPAGIEMFGRHAYSDRPPSMATLSHLRQVIVTRLWFEQRNAGRNPEWTSERELRWYALAAASTPAEKSAAIRARLVDAVASFDTQTGEGRRDTAIEVELSPKARDLLRRNMSNGLDKYDAAAWIVNDRTRALVTSTREELGKAGRRVTVYDLADIHRDLNLEGESS